MASAEKIVGQKGLNDATIAEIAKSAGVADAVIYQYFKGKEDLVFSIPLARAEDYYSQLGEHLQGIRDAENRLSKIIWYHLRYSDINPDFTKIFYYDCLSSKDFYSHPGHSFVRKYAQILLSCLEEGVANGEFRSDADPRLVRDMLMGFMGCEMLVTMTMSDGQACAKDLPDIMGLLKPMLTPVPVQDEGKAVKILQAAERIFVESGFNKTKVLDIAKLAGVAESTVYESFGTKEQLLMAIPERQLSSYADSLAGIFEFHDPVKKLRRYIKYYFSLFSTKRNFLKLFLLQIQMHRRFYESRANQEFFEKFFYFSDPIIEEGKASGDFRQDVNPRLFRNLFVGTFNNLTLRWFVLNTDSKIDKMRAIDKATDLLCDAVSAKPEARCWPTE